MCARRCYTIHVQYSDLPIFYRKNLKWLDVVYFQTVPEFTGTGPEFYDQLIRKAGIFERTRTKILQMAMRTYVKLSKWAIIRINEAYLSVASIWHF